MQGNDEIKLTEMLVFEKYFYSDDDIPEEEQYLYFQMLRQTKDFIDSKHILVDGAPTKFEMVLMSLSRIDDGVSFNGAISNGVENRWVDGTIIKQGADYEISTYVYRLHPGVNSSAKEYYVYDTFRTTNNGIAQETVYDESLEYRQAHEKNDTFKKSIPSFDLESFKQFKDTMQQKLKSIHS